MEQSKISIIIPVYNGKNTLEQCLSSVLNQTMNNYEVIVVDNNSNDNTKDIIQDFSRTNSKIKYVFEPQIGRGAARNKGILESTGEIIAMTDSDCVVQPHWLKEISSAITQGGESAVMGSEENISSNYWTKNIQKSNDDFFALHKEGKYIHFIDTKNFAIQKNIIIQHMFDDKIKALEDFELAFRIKKTIKIQYLPHLKVQHHHKSSLFSWAKCQMERGQWAYYIYHKHISNDRIKQEKMMESLMTKNLLIFPLWLLKQFFTKPLNQIPFILVSEISWRIGLLAHFWNSK